MTTGGGVFTDTFLIPPGIEAIPNMGGLRTANGS
jgi:hypothetical protein